MATATLQSPSMSPARAWVAALRVRTLGAGAAPVLVGGALAWDAGAFSVPVFAATLAAALLIQVGVNLANDYYDHRKGVDRADRLGPARVTGKALHEAAVLRATLAVLGLAALLGAYLAWVGGLPILAIGAIALVCALAYAGGPWPLGHHGLGEAFVFVFFGPVAVAGTWHLQTGAIADPRGWLSGVPLGALSAAILLVNNIRDIPTDARAGKRTLAVRLGARRSWAAYALLLALAYLALLALAARHGPSPAALLPWLSLPLALATLRQGLRSEGPALNAVLARTAQLTLLFGALLALGVAL